MRTWGNIFRVERALNQRLQGENGTEFCMVQQAGKPNDGNEYVMHCQGKECRCHFKCKVKPLQNFLERVGGMGPVPMQCFFFLVCKNVRIKACKRRPNERR